MIPKYYCCVVFKTGVEKDHVFLYMSDSNRYEINCDDLKYDYPVNFCPNCGKKLPEKFNDEKN